MGRSNLSNEARVDAAVGCTQAAMLLCRTEKFDRAVPLWTLVAMLRDAQVDKDHAAKLLDATLAVDIDAGWQQARLQAFVGGIKEVLGLKLDDVSAAALAADRSDERGAFQDYVRSLKPRQAIAIDIPIGTGQSPGVASHG